MVVIINPNLPSDVRGYHRLSPSEMRSALGRGYPYRFLVGTFFKELASENRRHNREKM